MTDELTRWHSGLFLHLEIYILGAEAIANESLTFGAALADLRREGWRLESVERGTRNDIPIALAHLSRKWDFPQSIPPMPETDGSVTGGSVNALADKSDA